MAEKTTPSLISDQEIKSIEETQKTMGAFHITLGYLYQLRTSPDSNLSLEKLHAEALSELIPGDDYDAYCTFHQAAFDYLNENSATLHIRVK